MRDAGTRLDEIPCAAGDSDRACRIISARVVDDDHARRRDALVLESAEASIEKIGSVARCDHDRSARE
jgi:hypothetical protein